MRAATRLAPTPTGRAVLAAGAAVLAVGFALAWPAAVVAGWAALLAAAASAGQLVRHGITAPTVELSHPVQVQEPCVVAVAGQQGHVRWAPRPDRPGRARYPAGADEGWTPMPASLEHHPAYPGVQ